MAAEKTKRIFIVRMKQLSMMAGLCSLCGI